MLCLAIGEPFVSLSRRPYPPMKLSISWYNFFTVLPIASIFRLGHILPRSLSVTRAM